MLALAHAVVIRQNKKVITSFSVEFYDLVNGGLRIVGSVGVNVGLALEVAKDLCRRRHRGRSAAFFRGRRR